MKLLFDQNISSRILHRLPGLFFESQQVRTVGLENESDAKIWRYARDNGFTIVTFDADFYDICLVKGCPPKIVWLRTGNLTTQEIASRIVANCTVIAEFMNDPEQECLVMR